MPASSLRFTAFAMIATLAASAAAPAADFLYQSDPFANTTALTTPGRQVVGVVERFIPNFSIPSDTFTLNTAFFPLSAPLSLFNGTASGIPASGFNIIVLTTTDNDNNPATPFNAGTAANLIAAQIETPGPGLFIYHNSGLQLSRLVFSTDLSVPTADLSVLARLTSPSGPEAIALLPNFTLSNFATTIPEPTSLALLSPLALLTLRLPRATSRGRPPLRRI